jgi:hypothetical protein
MTSAYSVSGTMDMELVPEGIRLLLKSAFSHEGTITPSALGSGAYESEFTPGNSGADTFSFETSAGDILVMRYGGVRINTLDITSNFNEIVTASFGLEGTTREKQGSTTSESYAETLPFHFTGSSVEVDSVEKANVKSFTFTVGNNIDRVGTLRKTRSWRRTTLGNRDVGLSMTLDFDSDDEYDQFLAEDEFSVALDLEGEEIGSSGTNALLRIEIPRVRFNMIGLPLTAGDNLEQSVETLILKPLNGDPIFTATLRSSEGSAF